MDGGLFGEGALVRSGWKDMVFEMAKGSKQGARLGGAVYWNQWIVRAYSSEEDDDDDERNCRCRKHNNADILRIFVFHCLHFFECMDMHDSTTPNCLFQGE